MSPCKACLLVSVGMSYVSVSLHVCCVSVAFSVCWYLFFICSLDLVSAKLSSERYWQGLRFQEVGWVCGGGGGGGGDYN